MSGTDRADRLTRTAALRRWIAAGVVVGVVAIGGIVWFTTRGSAAAPRWNVVLITLDTTRADRLGCYGYRRAETPTIDALAREGVRYERCYSPVPMTLPAHCSLLTGLLPPRHGIHDNGRAVLADEAETLAEILRRHGYDTGAVMGAFVLDRQFGLAQGFDHFDDDMSRGTELGRFHYAERNAELVTDAALAWWKRTPSGPKFLWVHYFDPHAPYSPPGFDPTFAHRTAYDAEIRFVDRHLKRLLAQVEAGAERGTLVVLCADHGEGLGEHGESTHGLLTYNSTLNVPLIVRFPDKRSAGSLVRTPVALSDVMPSVLNWLDISCPEQLDGMPLPLTDREPKDTVSRPRAIYFENRHVLHKYGWSPQVGIIAGAAKYIAAPRPELFDLRADPGETANRFDPHDRDSTRMIQWLAELQADLARRGPLRSPRADISRRDLARLRSLGYVGGGASKPKTSQPPLDLPDPKDMVDVFRRLEEAVRFIEQDQPAKAAEVLLAVINREDPKNKWAVRLLVELLEQDSEVRPAVVQCLLAMVRDPKDRHLEAYVPGKLGLVLKHSERYAEAIEAFECLLAIEPNLAAAHRHLGDIHRRLGRAEAAIGAYRRAMELIRAIEEPPDWAEDVRRHLNALQQRARSRPALSGSGLKPRTGADP